jgi:WD40 repeat protein
MTYFFRSVSRSVLYIAVLVCGFTQIANSQAATRPAFIWATEWSNDGKYVALGGDDSMLWVYSAENYSLLRTFKMNSMIMGLSWHPKEQLLAIATRRGVSLLSLPERTVYDVPDIHVGGRGISWNYNGELLALADGNGVVQLMNKKGKVLRSIKKHNNNGYMTIDFHPKKNIMVTGSDEVILFDTSGTQLKMFKHRNVATGILTVRWHPSGEFFALGDYGHDKEGIPTLLQFWKEDGTRIKEIRDGSKAEFRNIRWNHAGTMLATASDMLRIWSSEGKLLATGVSPDDNLWGVAWNRDDTRIITGTYGTGRVKLWSSNAALIRELR